MWNYSDKVMDHFLNPRNVGEVENADGVGEVGSMACGDALRLTFRLGEDGRIADAKFKTFGCGSAIASSSILTEMIRGKSLEEASRVTNEDIARELDGLPREKMHCSVMGREALEAAMLDYYKRQGKEVPCHLLAGTSLLCHCFQVTKETVREAIERHNLDSVEEVTHFTKAGGGCGDCHHEITDLLREFQDRRAAGAVATAPAGAPLIELAPLGVPAAAGPAHAPDDAAIVARISELLATEIAPALRADGGDIEFVRYADLRIHVRLTGSCAACRSSSVTISGLVEPRLREFIDPRLVVVEVGAAMSADGRQPGLLEGLPPRPEAGIYLDNNATTPVAPEVVAKMVPLLTEHYGNPSSMHSFGARAGDEVATARRKVATFLGAALPSEIVFTSGGSEGDNLAIVGTLHAYPEKRHLVTTEVEHPAVLGLCRELEKRHGYDVTFLKVDGAGRLDPATVAAALRPDTALVSVMMANNETGVLFDVDAIGKIVRAHGAVFHVDGVQAAGKLPLDLENMPVDLFAISGHKLHAAKGVGALYVRKGTKLRPLIVGGHQERGRRAGTENVASIAGLGVACDLALAGLQRENVEVRRLRDRLEQGLLAAIPDCQANGDPDCRLPNTTNISFRYIEGEGILLLLDRTGVAASSGSACTSGSLEPSHVLRAMGLPFTLTHGSIRFSLSRYNTEAEVDYVIAVLPRIIERLRLITPFNEQRATF